MAYFKVQVQRESNAPRTFNVNLESVYQMTGVC